MKHVCGKKVQPLFPVLILIAFFTAIWSAVIVQKYYAMNSTVFDLGVSSDMMYQFIHGPSIIRQFESGSVAMNKLIYIPMALFYNIDPNPLGLEIFQAVWLSLGALPVYLIARRKTSSRFFPFAASLLYLLYFPLGGSYYFDFHFIAIFPTFFLFGFYFYIAGKLKTSIAFMFLAIISDFLIPVIMVFFAIYVFIFDRRTKRFYPAILTAISVLIFTMTIAYFGIHYLLPYAGSITSGNSAAGQGVSYNILSYILDLSFPYGFIQFLSPETMIMSIPYFALVFFNHYFAYYSPVLYQYPALVAPIIAVSFIYGYKRLEKIFNKRYLKAMVACVIVISMVSFLLFTPPGNYATNDNSSPLISGANSIFINYYAVQDNREMPYDHSLFRMMDLIPEGSTVIIQNNMPQITNGYDWYLPANLSLNFRPEYILTDPYNIWFYNTSISPGYVSNMEYYVNYYISTGMYGIYAEAQGCMLLEYGYHGAPLFFEPVRWSLTMNGTPNFTLPFIAPGIYSITFTGNNNVSLHLAGLNQNLQLLKANNGIYRTISKDYVSNPAFSLTTKGNVTISIIQTDY